MLSRQEEEQERIETLRNDADVRRQQQQQGSTMFQHAVSQAADESGGRYGVAKPAPTVVGAQPLVKYPACSPASAVQLPDEPPTGIDINAMLELESSMVTSVTSPSVEAQVTPAGVEHAAPPSSFDGPVAMPGESTQRISQPQEPRVGSSSSHRDEDQ